MTEDEMVGWHHQLNGHEFEQALGDGEGRDQVLFTVPQRPVRSDGKMQPGIAHGSQKHWNSICILP